MGDGTASSERIRELREAYSQDALPLLQELAAHGYRVRSIGELRRLGRKYADVVPLLTHYLSRSTNASVKEDIVRTLSVPWARASAPAIADEFARVAANDESGLGWALGNALEVLAGPHLASRMYEFAEDRRYGRARQMVVLGLARIPSSQTVDVLIRLLADDEVVGHAAMALGKLKATPARQQLKLLESHPVDWVRKAVRKALINLDK